MRMDGIGYLDLHKTSTETRPSEDLKNPNHKGAGRYLVISKSVFYYSFIRDKKLLEPIKNSYQFQISSEI